MRYNTITKIHDEETRLITVFIVQDGITENKEKLDEVTKFKTNSSKVFW